ncbi:Hemin transport protein, partial [Mycobacterium tuberculosis]
MSRALSVGRPPGRPPIAGLPSAAQLASLGTVL